MAVLRALQLGDLLCAVPALRSLRAALPESEVTLIGLPWAREFVARYPSYLDRFLEFPGYPGLPERIAESERLTKFINDPVSRGFDLAIQLHGDGSVTNGFVRSLGAACRAGFFPRGTTCPDPELFLEYPGEGLEIRRLLSLVRHLGGPDAGEHLEFPVGPVDVSRARDLAGPQEILTNAYVCVHPGASVPDRRWPVERFAAVARALAGRGWQVVLTGGRAEQPLTRAVARELGGRCLDTAGRTDLGSLAALVEGAGLIVCNDTGVAHVAAAVGTPGVIVSTGDNPSRWAPTDRERYRVLCPAPEVSVADVTAACSALLASRAARAS